MEIDFARQAHLQTKTFLVGTSSFDRELRDVIEARESRVISWPRPLIQALENPETLDEAIENLFGYDWLIFKNEFAAGHFLQRFADRREAADLDQIRIMTIGEDSQETMAQACLHVDLAINRFDLANVFSAIQSCVGGRTGLAALNVVVPSAKLGRESFETQLEEAGARVDAVTAYRTVADTTRLVQLHALLAGGAIDGVIFVDSSALSDLACVLDTDDLGRVLKTVRIICADRETADTAAQFGLPDASTALQPTIERLLDLTN